MKKKNTIIGLSLLLALFITTFSIYGLANLSYFLALNRAIEAEVLVVEGWLFEYMLDDVVAEIKHGRYTVVLISGFENDFRAADEQAKFNSVASNAAYLRERLIEKGIDEALLQAVTAPRTKYHRTYSSAVAIKDWLIAHDIDAVNVLSSGTHARKTYVIYRRVLREDIKVGIISCETRHFDSLHWWTTLKGMRITFRHLVGYLYALCWPFYAF